MNGFGSITSNGCRSAAKRRSAQAQRGRLGIPLWRAIGAEPLPCLYLNVKDTSSRTAPLSLSRAVAFVLRFLSGREPGGVQRQSLKLPYAGWLPHERVSSQACLALSAGVGNQIRPQGAHEDHHDRLPGCL